jgi:serine protease AprX
MKKTLFLAIFALAVITETYAQGRYVIFFSDKNNTPYSVSSPLAYLSQRAVNRRAAQNINITQQDFPVNPAYVAAVANTGATILNSSRWFNSVTVEVSDPNMLNTILNLTFVSNSSEVGRYGNTANGINKFNSEKFIETESSQLNSQRTSSFNYGTSFNQVSMMKGDLMHNNGYTGAGKIIAVLDAGFSNADNMPVFDSLRANNQILATWDFVDNETDVYDDDQHGTMVLSCIGGNTPGELIGTAPGASFLLLRSEYAPAEAIIEEYNWASAAEYADSAGADVINSSLGYTVFDNPIQNHSYADLDGNTTPISRAAGIAASKGMVVCNSAGNEGNSNWFRLSAPSDAINILGVGAVDPMGLYASFSGKGPSVDGRIKPDVASQGAQTVVANPWTGLGTITGNGTSFASPLMAGMVATLWQCHPASTYLQIINAIRQSASQASNPDSLLGYGIPDFPVACMLLSGLNPGSPLNGDQVYITGNPFGEELIFNFYSNTPQKISVSLTDILGKVILKNNFEVNGLTLNEIKIPASFANGVYVLEVISENKQFAEKVIKQ